MDRYNNAQALAAYKAKIVEEEKARLLREHLPYIEDFLPKGILEIPDPNKMADKYLDRILDEVSFNFERHFTDKEERVEFLEELIEELEDLLEETKNIENNDE